MSIIPIGELNVQCGNCGSSELPIPAGATDDTVIVCSGCSEPAGTVAEIRQLVEDAARAAMPDVARQVRDALKGIKGFEPR